MSVKIVQHLYEGIEFFNPTNLPDHLAIEYLFCFEQEDCDAFGATEDDLRFVLTFTRARPGIQYIVLSSGRIRFGAEVVQNLREWVKVKESTKADSRMKSALVQESDVIYVIKLSDGWVKVGFSSNVEQRLIALSVSCPKAKIVKTYPSQTIGTERSLHEQLKSIFRRNRESYKAPVSAVVAAVDNLLGDSDNAS